MRGKNLIALALSVSMLSTTVAQAGPGDVNSTNTGQNINGGVYYNTPGSRTTFENSGGTLHLQKGQLVRGLESDINKALTGNGGTLYFRADMIRLDGDIDASAVKNGSLYMGNGGKVFMDASYLYQTGNIYANGYNGGLIQFDVGAATIAPTARIMAEGFGGNGGAININSPGAVDIQRGAILDSSGKVSGTYDTNVISIVGGLVNNEGLLRADGVAIDMNQSPLDGALLASNPHLADKPAPGPISPGEGTGVVLFGPPLEFAPSAPTTARGGTIRLVAAGQTRSEAQTIANSNLLHPHEKKALLQREKTLKANDGDIANAGIIEANGGIGENGGSILMAAADDISNQGVITALGKNGGTISMNAMDQVNILSGLVSASGLGGDGGLLAFSYNTMGAGHGLIDASGHDGGLIVFSGNSNPGNLSRVKASGFGGKAGTIALPTLSSSARTSLQDRARGAHSANLVQTRKNELLIHDENAILVSRSGGAGNTSNTLTGRLDDAVIRTVDNPNGLDADPVDSIKHKTNFVFAGTTPDSALTMDFSNANIFPIFSRPNTLMVLNNGDITNNMHWSPGISLVGKGSHDTVFALGGGHISLLSAGSITNNGFLLTRGLWSGGSMNLSAKQDITNNKVMITTTFNKDLASAFAPAPGYISSHSGSMILKALRDITNTHRIGTNYAFYDIHPPLNVPGLIWPRFLNDAQIGATMYLQAGRNFLNASTGQISADALTYRHDQLGMENPANAYGGIIRIKAGGTFTNNGIITADGDSYQDFDDNRPNNGPKFSLGVTFDDLKEAASKDGAIIQE